MLTQQTSSQSEGAVSILVNGRPMTVRAGQTVAGALLATSQRTLRRTARQGTPRGLFCGMGVCYDCLVTIDGQRNRRACMTMVSDGLRIEIAER